MADLVETRAAIRGRSDAEILTWIERVGGTQAFLELAFAGMQEAFVAERAGEKSAVVEWDIVTPDMGVQSYQVLIGEGECRVEPGRFEQPGVTLSMQIADFLRIVVGTLDARLAVAQGKLTVSGDVVLAGALREWFPITS
jgi:putative sterol carrier protein